MAATGSPGAGASPPAAATPPGCCWAPWLPEGDGGPPDFRTFLLPASDYVIDDVWDTVGLRGTGSNDIVVDGAFVPEHRSLSFVDVFRLRLPRPGHQPGAAVPAAVRVAVLVLDHHPIIGMAVGAYDAHVAYQRERVRRRLHRPEAREDPFGQVRIAEAAAELDSAGWLHGTTWPS